MWGHPADLDGLAPQPHSEHLPGEALRKKPRYFPHSSGSSGKEGWVGRSWESLECHLKICTVTWRQWRDRGRAGLFHHEIMAPRSKPALLGSASCLA